VQGYAPAELLEGEQVTTHWDDATDDVMTVPGKAVCESIEALAAVVPDWDDDGTLVTLEGVPRGRDGHTVFVQPPRVLAVEPVSARFAAAVEAVRASHGGTGSS